MKKINIFAFFFLFCIVSATAENAGTPTEERFVNPIF